MEPIRLNKYLSAAGICSRREADRLIAGGTVLVDGVPADMGMKVTDENVILVNGELVFSLCTSQRALYALPRSIKESIIS